MESMKGVMDGFISANPVMAAVLFFGFIVLVLIVTTVFRRKCPSCGKYRAGEVTASRREQALIGHSKRMEVDLKCRYCGHEWQATESRSRKRTHSGRAMTPEAARAKIEQIDQALADPEYKVTDAVRKHMITSRDDLKKYL